MSRITESLRRTIREEVQKSLRRKLHERSGASQEIVRQIQTALGMSNVGGIWGRATDAAWATWLETNKNKLKLKDGTIAPYIDALKTNWAENSKNITHVLSRPVTDGEIQGTPAGILKLIELFNTTNDEIASISAAKQTDTRSVNKGTYTDMSVDELRKVYDSLAAVEKAAADRGGFYGSNKYAAISAELKKLHAAILDKIATSNDAEAAKLQAMADKFEDIDPSDTFKSSDSALASTQKDAADDAADRKVAMTESRWLRLAGLLKG